MSIYEGISAVIGVTGAVTAAWISIRANNIATSAKDIANNAMRYQMLQPLLAEYKSPEMAIAIRSLWNFYRQHKDQIILEYKKLLVEDFDKPIDKEFSKQVDYIRSTIDFQRRIVSQFYFTLTFIYDDGGIHRKWIYTYWKKSDLEIIPKIIIPMEKCLAEALEATLSSSTMCRLKKLYDDAPE